MITTIKLNLWPNYRKVANLFITIITCLQLIAIYFPCSSPVTCLQLVAQNEISKSHIDADSSIAHTLHQEKYPPINNTQQVFSTTNRPEVENLRLISDYRAIKLQWSFQHNNDSTRPVSFDIRYCELTSWNIEIKCRHKDLKVEDVKVRWDNTDKHVIKTVLPIETVFQLNPPNGHNYEAQIYDLRALTNYTFQVRVARFANEPELESISPSFLLSQRRQRNQAARRLTQETAINHPNELATRIETKAFTAEATKCLADVSEVLVNTGRYFGGRISVENSVDPRCNLLGNRSSEQTSYLFRIDHEICKSKLVDGSRIETMVLVHENKDILTHNTARFLVLCNFLQKSFTLKASVSLPKVNGLIGGGSGSMSRPAVITPLVNPNGRSQLLTTDSSASAEQAYSTAVTLGSMSGIYRARVPPHSSESTSPIQLMTTTTSLNTLDELESSNIIAGEAKLKVRKFLESQTGGRQAKELDSTSVVASSGAGVGGYGGGGAGNGESATMTSRRRVTGMNGSTSTSSEEFARSLALSSETSSVKFLPKPVQVQSKVLYVERPDVSSSLRNGRSQQLQAHLNAVQATTTTTQSTGSKSKSKSNSASAGEQESNPMEHSTTPIIAAAQSITIQERENRKLKQLARLVGQDTDEQLAASDLQATPIIMTNNHRVAGDFLQPIAHRLSSSDNQNNQYSIKYSPAKIDEYPFASLQGRQEKDALPIFELNGSQIRPARTGRMRVHSNPVSNQPENENEKSLPYLSSNSQAPSNSKFQLQQQQQQAFNPINSWNVNRMGESINNDASSSDLLAETSNETSNYLPLQQFNVSSSSSPSSSIAHNVTSYLLKWSLKTLSNLARKSIESLIKSNEMESSHSNNLMLTESQQLDDLMNPSNQTLISTNSARNFLLSTQIPEDEPSSTTTTSGNLLTSPSSFTQENRFTERSPTSTTSSLLKTPSNVISESSKSEADEKLTAVNSDEALDGFITNRRNNRNEDSKFYSTNNNSHRNSRRQQQQQQQQQHLRPSNYSKSLDLSRGETSLSLSRQRANTTSNSSEKSSKGNLKQQESVSSSSSSSPSSLHVTTLSSSPKTIEKNQSTQQQPHYNESVWSNKDSFYSSWIFYSMLLLVALIFGIFLSICFVSSSSSSSSSSSCLSSQCTERRQNRNSIMQSSSIRPIAGLGVAGCSLVASSLPFDSNRSICNDSYQKYDYNKFENYSTNETINSRNRKEETFLNENKLLNQHNRQQSPPSPMSQSTQSTSVGSSASILMSTDENDCKNNEFLYTEHVLINTGSSFGESYA